MRKIIIILFSGYLLGMPCEISLDTNTQEENLANTVFQLNSANETLKLNGYWAIDFKKFYNPEKEDNSQFLKYYENLPSIKVPGNWQKFSYGGRLSKPTFGYATYFAKINSKKLSESTFILMPELFGAYEIYLWNAENGWKKIGGRGKLHKSLETSSNMRMKNILELGKLSQENILMIHQSSFLGSFNGLLRQIQIGPKSLITWEYNYNIILNSSILGLTAFYALFYFVWYLLNKNTQENLCVGIIALTACMYILSSTGILSALLPLDSQKTIEYFYRLEFLSIATGGYATLEFTRVLLEKNNKILLSIRWFTLRFLIFYYILTFFLTTSEMSSLVILNQIPLLVGIVSALSFSVYKTFKGSKTALFVMLGFTLLCGGVFIDVAESYNIYSGPLVFKYTVFFFFIMNGWASAYNTAKIHKRTIILSENLEEEVKIQTAEIHEQNQQLNEKIIESKNLLKIIVHDMANSMTIVGSSIPLVSKAIKQNDEDKANKFLEKIKTAQETQFEIMNQVKELEAVTDKKIDVKLHPVNLNKVIDKIRFIFEDKLKAKNIKLITNGLNPRTPLVLADRPTLTNSVIANIVSNAIKFTKENGKITIFISFNMEFVNIRISDRGIGMPEKLVKNIFSKDQKTTRKGTNGEVGTGFGMPIMAMYVEKYGGKVEVESKNILEYPERHGTTFTLSLKRAGDVL